MAWRISSSVGLAFAFEQRVARHHHPRRAKAALQAVLLIEALLDRVELPVLLEPFDRHDLPAVGLDGEHGAGLDGRSVEQHRACAAVRRVAADVRARQPQGLADEVDEQQRGTRPRPRGPRR